MLQFVSVWLLGTVLRFVYQHDCRYEYYFALLRDFPEIKFTLNGGITNVGQVSVCLTIECSLPAEECVTEIQGLFASLPGKLAWARHLSQAFIF
jgi:hypothetical protein